ncbi:hypothetical protein BC938DRAFT_475751 [Jimgerdemannia flammicorona]|uniref:Uncharacterized protein n=1 Tax=Jimgerdemannia flammicorona TaxID=994334 RepID=A0A433PPE0_9FUNG|nr:hypothetical protein BC938DRAFT_475751 [Jimgerdemannia flammicorona]
MHAPWWSYFDGAHVRTEPWQPDRQPYAVRLCRLHPLGRRLRHLLRWNRVWRRHHRQGRHRRHHKLLSIRGSHRRNPYFRRARSRGTPKFFAVHSKQGKFSAGC